MSMDINTAMGSLLKYFNLPKIQKAANISATGLRNYVVTNGLKTLRKSDDKVSIDAFHTEIKVIKEYMRLRSNKGNKTMIKNSSIFAKNEKRKKDKFTKNTEIFNNLNQMWR